MAPYLNYINVNKLSNFNFKKIPKIKRQLEEHTQDDCCLLLTSQQKTHSDCQIDQYVKEICKQKKCCLFR